MARIELSSRTLTLCIVAFLIAVGASGFVLAELAPTSAGCPGCVSGIRAMTFNNRTYYGDAIDVNITVGIAAGTYTLRGNSTNASFFGFKFSITPWQYGFGESVLNTTIVEPGGSVFHGGPYWTGEAGVFSNSWFTPDNKSGVYAVPGAETETPSYPIATVVLLVEPGIWGI